MLSYSVIFIIQRVTILKSFLSSFTTKANMIMGHSRSFPTKSCNLALGPSFTCTITRECFEFNQKLTQDPLETHTSRSFMIKHESHLSVWATVWSPTILVSQEAVSRSHLLECHHFVQSIAFSTSRICPLDPALLFVTHLTVNLLTFVQIVYCMYLRYCCNIN